MTSSDDQRMDAWLARTMAAEPPRLTPAFDRRLDERLHRRLGSGARWTLGLYAGASLAASLWVMRSAALDWSVITGAVLIPAALLAVVSRYYRSTIPP